MFVFEIGRGSRYSVDMKTTTAHRPLSDIAQEITEDWAKPYFGAVPYLDAMRSLGSIEEDYHYDSGRSVVLYFLGHELKLGNDKVD